MTDPNQKPTLDPFFTQCRSRIRIHSHLQWIQINITIQGQKKGLRNIRGEYVGMNIFPLQVCWLRTLKNTDQPEYNNSWLMNKFKIHFFIHLMSSLSMFRLLLKLLCYLVARDPCRVVSEPVVKCKVEAVKILQLKQSTGNWFETSSSPTAKL